MTDIKTVLTDEQIAEIRMKSYYTSTTKDLEFCHIEQCLVNKERSKREIDSHKFARAIEAAVLASTGGKVDAIAQPELVVIVESYPESNGNRNWTATLRPVNKWDGLIGSLGGITIARGECWNRVAYEAERARFMLGSRDTEPFILDYGDDIETPEQWKGESGTAIKRRFASQSPQDQVKEK